MSLVTILPNWHRTSERWAWRMIDSVAEAGDLVVGESEYETPQACQGRHMALRQPSLPRRLMARTGVTAYSDDGRWGRQRLIRHIQRHNPQAALVHYATCALRLEEVWQATDVPLFVHCHGYDVCCDLRVPQCPERRVHPPDYAERIVELSDRAVLIANSSHTAAQLLGFGVPQEKIVVKHLGVEIVASSPVRHRQRTDFTVLFVGRLVDFKGPDLLIRSFERACAMGLRGRLVIAGDGYMRLPCELVRARSPVRERITFLGETSWADVDRLFGDADVFATHNVCGPLTRQEEAFGVTFVEAMARGLPVASTRSGAIPEVVGVDEGALLVEPGDIDGQARVLLELSANTEQRTELGRRGRARAERLFSSGRERADLSRILGLSKSTRRTASLERGDNKTFEARTHAS
jgi:colanic acid/amylovoran biosynthesis glycosyltransferase